MQRILFIARSNLSPAHHFAAGLQKCCSEQGYDWEIEAILNPGIDELKALKADGAVVYSVRRHKVSALAEHRFPILSIFPVGPWPAIALDDVQAGLIAGRFLLKSRHSRILYVGSMEEAWSRERYQGMLEVVHGRISTDAVWFDRLPYGYTDEFEQLLIEKLQLFKHPLALMGADDSYAIRAERVCLKLGLRVPQDVSILGVNNSLPAELAPVPISSVKLPCEIMGRTAGRLLARLLNGEDVPMMTRVVPTDLQERESTSPAGMHDDLIAAALEIIRERFSDGINATDVANALGVSISSLQKRFRRKLGIAVGQQLRTTRLNHARRLMANASLSLSDIATACGFQSAAYFSRVFRQAEGVAPRTFRRNLQQA